MPELPEVETIRRQLEAAILGEIVQDMEVRTKSITQGIPSSVVGSTISTVRRLSKLLLVDTSHKVSIAIHLKMTGRVILQETLETDIPPAWEFDYRSHPHTHIVMHFKSGKKLYFHDYRRFGRVEFIPTSQVNTIPYIATLGKEFFRNLDEDEFCQVLSKSNRAIKVLLLDQTVVAGVGNIYANEALWEAQIHPDTPAKEIYREAKLRLFHALEDTMHQSLEHLGASSDNFRDIHGRKGKAQEHFSVYGREGKACLRCGTKIQKFMLSGRGTYVCLSCQNQLTKA